MAWGAEILLFSIKLLSFLKRLIAAFFISLILRFGWIILRFVFYRLIVKVYKSYLSIIKKLEWTGFRNNPFLFLMKQKLVHIAVATVTLLLVLSNINAKADDSHINIADTAGNTILASLVQSEFGTIDQEQLIEEFFDEEATISPIQQKYLEDLTAVQSDPLTYTKEESHEHESEDEFETSTSYDNTAVIKPDIASTVKTVRPRSEIVYYDVLPGDVIGSIAEKFNINVSTILWENSLSAYSVIRPGDRLTILPTNGISYKVERGDSLEKIAKKYGI
ncbi:MAG: LysM peptidoglycan-binding domain-containing protein, partial [Patescibacteria group bacterium]